MDTLWDNIEKLSAVCRAAGAHLPDEELKALQVGKVAEEAGEAMHALHGLKGLTTCGDDHTWSEVQNDLVGSVIAALLAMHYIDPTGARATFDEIVHRRTRRGRCCILTISVRNRRPRLRRAVGGHAREPGQQREEPQPPTKLLVPEKRPTWICLAKTSDPPGRR
ncbi:MazG-like family protein [Streptomyces sp. TE33382]